MILLYSIDLKIARPLLATMHKMHRAGVDNYVTYKNKVRKLTPRECLRLMGYDDSFKIVVSDTNPGSPTYQKSVQVICRGFEKADLSKDLSAPKAANDLLDDILKCYDNISLNPLMYALCDNDMLKS